jgi:hypothetical protein
MPRELGWFAPSATQLLLRLPREKIWSILDALQRLCDDPNLGALQEEHGETFIIAAGYAVSVAVGNATISVLALRKLGAN